MNRTLFPDDKALSRICEKNWKSVLDVLQAIDDRELHVTLDPFRIIGVHLPVFEVTNGWRICIFAANGDWDYIQWIENATSKRVFDSAFNLGLDELPDGSIFAFDPYEKDWLGGNLVMLWEPSEEVLDEEFHWQDQNGWMEYWAWKNGGEIH